MSEMYLAPVTLLKELNQFLGSGCYKHLAPNGAKRERLSKEPANIDGPWMGASGGAPQMSDKTEFEKVFEDLKSILKPYAKKMDIAHDTDTYYLLNTRYIMKNKQPLCFGGVRLGKAYVSFYLMSVYASPGLLKGMSPELKKRMQGKSCFNFKEVDEKLFKELAQLTKAGAATFSDVKL